MIDIHTHILPSVDDGSKNVHESITMLGMLSDQGVDTVVATPHFYGELTTPEDFFKTREQSAETLKNELDSKIKRPQIALGAEVEFYNEMHRLDCLEEFCISGTKYILIEMPFIPWTNRTYQTLEQIVTDRGLTPIVAHIERYPEFKLNSRIISNLQDVGALIQINSDFIYERSSCRKALKLIKKGAISFIGSDAHNAAERKPDIGNAYMIMTKKLKPVNLETLKYNEEKLKETLITF